MSESPYQGKHTFCATCKSTFPRSWLERGAVRKNGRHFCSQKCADTFSEFDPVFHEFGIHSKEEVRV